MTCVVGLEHRDRVFIGADSAAVSSDESVVVWSEPKAFRNRSYVMSFAGSFRVGQLVKHAFVPPPFDGRDHDMTAFLATQFVDVLRATLSSHGVRGLIAGTSLLVGHRGMLHKVEPGFQVNRAVDGFFAIGSGETLALGALHATRTTCWDAKKRLRHALEAAAAYDVNVRPPFVFVATRGARKKP